MHQPLTADLNPADEVVAVYDRTGNPIGRAPRSVVYSGGLWHASAGVLVRTGDGSRIYVHRRTDTKAVFGGYHDCLAGGVVDPGETPQETAIREVGEELGIFGTADQPLQLTEIARKSWTASGKTLRCAVTCLRSNSDTTGRWHISPARSPKVGGGRRKNSAPTCRTRRGRSFRTHARCWPTIAGAEHRWD